ncbi:MAG: CsgE family curli-type amyloid fiber assembly protein [Lutibacter sp.]|nr:CsgE family curli-type amyloid fiber assembly protein [Lutibacter sp.]
MKTAKINMLPALILLFTAFTATPIFSQESVRAKIVAKVADNLIDAKAVAQNNEGTIKDDYSYLLFSLKKGEQGNYSRNSQSGQFSLEPNEEKELASLKINIQKDEECKIFLFIRKDDALISKDSIIIYSAEKEKKNEVIAESNFEIKGIVVDDVITKIGKDFHDYFYQDYSNSGNQYPFVINIKEKPYFGRSSIITIEIEDQNIFEFITKPDEEFLRDAVKSALQNINQFAIKRKLLYKNSRM